MSSFDVAIIGASARVPGASSRQEFWSNLRNGVDSITRWTDPSAPGNFVGAGGLLDRIDVFDAGFFRYAPREAVLMDPQHRIFLECAWHALEDSGIAPDHPPGRIGAYVSAALGGYLLNQVRPSGVEVADLDQLISNDKDFLATRLAYKFDLRGPCVVIQSACSSSLVAVHFACQGLLSGDSDIALAGGITVRVPHRAGYLYEEGMIFSPDGMCRAFDRSALGGVPSNGAGIVVLTRLEDALTHRHTILAVIRGSAINNDGGRKAGYTAPSAQGQSEVIAAAQRLAGVEPGQVTYVEAHGSGTPLGDAIEVQALKDVFGSNAAQPWCALASLKTNVGHLDVAAGVAGLIKAAAAIHHRELPPSLHCPEPNPDLGLTGSPFFINTELRSWTHREPIAGVSSFGIGGTNAHIVLGPAPIEDRAAEQRHFHILPFSARSAEAARQMAAQPLLNARLDDVAFTLQHGRNHFEHRCVVTTDSTERHTNATSVELGGSAPAVAFLFPGLGEQSRGMAHALYTSHPSFRCAVDECLNIVESHMNVARLGEFLLTPSVSGQRLFGTRSDEPATDMHTAHLSLFVTEYALAKLWISWGVQPAALLGFSLGEFVAGCVGGALPLEDALGLVLHRARLVETCAPGEMLAVSLSEDELRPRLAGKIEIAAQCSRFQTVVSGTPEAIDNLRRELAQEAIACRPIAAGRAFHSSFLAGAANALETPPHEAPHVPIASTVTGSWLTGPIPEYYWRRHLTQPIRFCEAVAELWKLDNPVLLEVGPGSTLTALALQNAPSANARALASLPTFTYENVLHAAGRLWMFGQPLDWSAIDPHTDARRIPMHGYPFERQRYWIDGAAQSPPLELSAPVQNDEQTELESAVIAVWQKVLGAAHIGPESNFFALGGDSLLGIKVVTALKNILQLDIPLKTLWHNATPRDLAAWIEKALEEDPEPAAIIEPEISSSDTEATFALHHLSPKLNDAALYYIARAFAKLAIAQTPGAHLALDQSPIHPIHHKLATRWLKHLARTGHIQPNSATGCKVMRPLQMAAPPELTLPHPNYRAILELFQRAGEHLPEILTGAEDPLRTFFPNGDTSHMISAYRDIPETRFCLKRAACLVQSWGKQPNSVLEVGAGFGIATQALRPALPSDVRYVFTDISPFFFDQAADTCSGAEFRLYDIDLDPRHAGLTPASFDVIVASNALHCARDVHRTLRHLRSLLRPDGRLLLIEATQNELWHSITMGLLKGFFQFEDFRLTDSLTFLTRDQWTQALDGCGFTLHAIEPDQPATGQHVFFAGRK